MAAFLAALGKAAAAKLAGTAGKTLASRTGGALSKSGGASGTSMTGRASDFVSAAQDNKKGGESKKAAPVLSPRVGPIRYNDE